MDEAKKFMTNVLQTLQDRIGNPLIGAFCAAWAVWNFKIVLAIFGSGKEGWRDKVKFIFEEEMKTRLDWFIHGYAIPGAIALLWIFALPPILRWIQVWHESQLNKTRAAIYKATNQRTLTKEEEIALRNHLIEEKSKIAEDKEKSSKALQENAILNEKLTADLVSAQTDNSTLTQQIENLKAKDRELQQDIKRLNDIITPPPMEAKISGLRDQNRKNKFLTDMGFVLDNELTANSSPINHEHYSIEFPAVIKRDVIYEGEKVFSLHQILEDETAAALISIMDYCKKRGIEEIPDTIFQKEVLKNTAYHKMNLRNSLKKWGYIEVLELDEVPTIKIHQSAINAGHLLQRLGFKRTSFISDTLFEIIP